MRRALIIACLVLAGPANAAPLYEETDDLARRTAIDKAHRQLATCAAYYAIGAEGMDRGPANRAIAERVDRAIGDLLDQMLRLRRPDVTRARVDAERMVMMNAIGSDIRNYRMLSDRLAEPCDTIARNPEGFVDRATGG